MLRDRIMMGATISSLPLGYTKIEYLESDGNSYIDTRFVPNQDTRVKMSILASGLSGETYAYGARNSAGSNAFLCALEPTVITFGYAIQYRAYEGVIDGRYDIDQNKNIITVNGTEISGNYVESFSSESNLTLFGRNTAGSVEKLSAIKLYSCQIYDNGVLVRDLIPCTNPDGISGLWDSVNDVFYKMLPADYTRLDFIESDGTTYIDTGFKPNQDTRVVMDVHLLSTTTGDGYPMAFGVYTNNTNRFASFWNNSKWQVWLGDSSSSISSSNIERCVIDLQNGQYTVGSQSTSVSSSSFSSNLTLYLLAMNQGDVYYVSAARIYSCRIYDNGTLVRDFIPAMNASGEAGLYDLKNDVWYALLPVAKPKVENTIRVRQGDFKDLMGREGIEYGFIAQYSLASDVTIYYKGDDFTNGVQFSSSFIMKKGQSGAFRVKTNVFSAGIGIVGARITAITSISPTEDDTYIYTF